MNFTLEQRLDQLARTYENSAQHTRPGIEQALIADAGRRIRSLLARDPEFHDFLDLNAPAEGDTRT